MYGLGILKGLRVTLKRFTDTYLDDLTWWGRRYFKAGGIAHRSSKDTRGIFTVQYPEEKLPVPEEFRYVPFLVYDEVEAGREIRCTSCGICAKVCPPQCIWIVRSNDPQTGRPIPEPTAPTKRSRNGRHATRLRCTSGACWRRGCSTPPASPRCAIR